MITTLMALLALASVYLFARGTERWFLFGASGLSILLMRAPALVRDLLPRKISLAIRPPLLRAVGGMVLVFTVYRLALILEGWRLSAVWDVLKRVGR